MKYFIIILALSITSCTHQEGVDYVHPFQPWLVSVPPYPPQITPPESAPDFTPTNQPTFIPAPSGG